MNDVVSPSISMGLQDFQRLRAGVVSDVAFASIVRPVQFTDDGTVKAFVCVEAHRHYAAVSIAGEDDRIAALNIIGNHRNLVHQPAFYRMCPKGNVRFFNVGIRAAEDCGVCPRDR